MPSFDGADEHAGQARPGRRTAARPAKMAGVTPDRQPGRGPTTLRDVAAAAGVHPATASRALNPETRALVNQETAERVLEAARTLGYRPNPIARGLKTNRSYTIGVVVPDLRNPIFPPMARGIEARLEPAGYTSLLANTDNDPEREQLSFDALRARQVDGFITATARREHPLLDELAEEGVPLVLMNRSTDKDDLPSALPDDRRGVQQAVEHLASLGHTAIAHFAVRSVSTGEHRWAGFSAAMEELNLRVDPDLIVEGGFYSEAEGARCTRRLLETGKRFTAVVAANDLMALGCIDVLREAGLECPRDVSVVGFNDMDWSDRFVPPLTTVRLPHYQLGVEAAGLLLERLANPGAPARHVVLPAELVVRGSTAPPPADEGSAGAPTRPARAAGA
jgi:LacI family transcriptional regulator